MFNSTKCRCPFAENKLGLPERTNEAAGNYAKACLAVAAECGVSAIDLWTKMQQIPGWQTACLRYLIPSSLQEFFFFMILFLVIHLVGCLCILPEMLHVESKRILF